MTDRNARLTPVIRRELVQQMQAGWPQAEVARRFRVSRHTVAKWWFRFRAAGEAGLVDRRSGPHRHARRTTPELERRICAVRRGQGFGPHRIAWALGLARSTVYAVLRHGVPRMAVRRRAPILQAGLARPRVATSPLRHGVAGDTEPARDLGLRPVGRQPRSLSGTAWLVVGRVGDGLASGESGIPWVPPLDLALAHSPAPVGRHVLDVGGEVEQAFLYALDLNAPCEDGG